MGGRGVHADFLAIPPRPRNSSDSAEKIILGFLRITLCNPVSSVVKILS